MKLISFRVRMFRNILDSGECVVESTTTCLVGMNESGKSTILEALYRLRPAYGEGFQVQRDYPRWRLSPDRRRGRIDSTRPISAEFELSSSDISAVEEVLGAGVVTSPNVSISRNYANHYSISIAIDDAKVVRELVSNFDLAEDLTSSLSALGNLSDLARLDADQLLDPTDSAQDDETGERQQAIAELNRLRDAAKEKLGDNDDANSVARRMVLTSLLPQIFLFSRYQELPGRIDVRDLENPSGEAPGASGLQTARSLLILAHTTAAALASSDYEDRVAELEAVSNELSEQVSEYWSQNPELRVRMGVDVTTETANNGQKAVARYLDIRVEDRRHEFTNNFTLRSSGFKWFFSFLAAFTEFTERGDPVIVLLDEPALTLHAKAQRDFLQFISERLASDYQTIYTTHSPFMVGPLEQVRLVEDRGRIDGAVVTDQVLEVGADSAFPLQAALGYDLSQHLFIGDANLVVEGSSDFVYLDVISRYLWSISREGLDERWRLLPAGGSSNVPAFITLLGAKLDVTVLVDSGTEGIGRVQAAIESGRLRADRLIAVGDITQARHADIEDLFSPGDYLLLYNAAFNKRHKVSDLTRSIDRIVKQLEQLDGKFDHWAPAQELLRVADKRLPAMSATTLDNFEKLSRRVNNTLSS